ncbi:MAG: hypothetical protein ACAI25_02530 [Planctomycetota bacterium]
MLDDVIEAEIEVRDKHVYQGRERIEATLVSDDGQTLHIYEGQLKDLGRRLPAVEVGKRYKVAFRPFINNRWIEVKIVRLEPVVGGGE